MLSARQTIPCAWSVFCPPSPPPPPMSIASIAPIISLSLLPTGVLSLVHCIKQDCSHELLVQDYKQQQRRMLLVESRVDILYLSPSAVSVNCVHELWLNSLAVTSASCLYCDSSTLRLLSQVVTPLQCCSTCACTSAQHHLHGLLDSL